MIGSAMRPPSETAAVADGNAVLDVSSGASSFGLGVMARTNLAGTCLGVSSARGVRGIGIESKIGTTSLTRGGRAEDPARDVELLNDPPSPDTSVEWHFASSITNAAVQLGRLRPRYATRGLVRDDVELE